MAPAPVRDVAACVRTLNDNFRSTFIGGQVLMTQGVDALPIDTKARVILAVQRFNEFSADNDPHREHDFGSFEVEGETYFLENRLLRPRHGRRLGRPRRSREDDARAHHHACRRVLTTTPNRRRPAMAQQPAYRAYTVDQTRRPR